MAVKASEFEGIVFQYGGFVKVSQIPLVDAYFPPLVVHGMNLPVDEEAIDWLGGDFIGDSLVSVPLIVFCFYEHVEIKLVCFVFVQ